MSDNTSQTGLFDLASFASSDADSMEMRQRCCYATWSKFLQNRLKHPGATALVPVYGLVFPDAAEKPFLLHVTSPVTHLPTTIVVQPVQEGTLQVTIGMEAVLASKHDMLLCFDRCTDKSQIVSLHFSEGTSSSSARLLDLVSGM